MTGAAAPSESIAVLADASPARTLGRRPFEQPRMKRLRDLTQKADFTGQLAGAQLAAATGDFARADALIAACLRRHPALLPESNHFLSSLLCTAIACQRLDIAGALLTLRERHPFRANLAGPLPGKMVVRATIEPDRTCVLTLKPGTVGGAHIERLVSQLLGVVTLLGPYAADPATPPGTTLVSLGDVAIHPGLGFSSVDPNVQLIPDPHFINSRGYATMRATLAACHAPWADRAPVGFWRGSSTGIRTGADNHWRTLQRIALCQLSLEAPALIDAGINKVVQATTATEAAEIEAAGLMRPSVPPTEFKRFRYQIDVDGNSNSWGGLFTKLLTGSPVLKIASPRGFRQWYYDRLVPDETFVPIRADMADLTSRIEALRRDDALAEAIGAAGERLAASLDYASQVQASRAAIAAAVEAEATSGKAA